LQEELYLKKPDCIKVLDRLLSRDVLVVTPTGKTYMYWEATEREAQVSQVNLGLCTAVGLGLALALPHRKVVVLDGDGNILFNLAALADLSVQNPANLIDIIFDNECYQSCDSFPSVTSRGVDLQAIARDCGITRAVAVNDLDQFEGAVKTALGSSSVSVIVAKLEPGEESVPLPRREGRENMYRFVRYIERTENIEIIKPYARRRTRDMLSMP
jgi:sulfopyruvate decarboxylase subunit beta